MSTLSSVAEIPEEEFVDRVDEVLRRVKAGEHITLIADGKPVVVIRPSPASRPRLTVGWDEFWTWPKADRGMLEVLQEIRADSGDDWIDPWERYGDGR